jgi:hypothetical protein
MDRSDGRFVILLASAELPTGAADRPGAKADWCDGQIGVTEALCFHLRFRFRFRVFCSHRSNLSQFMDFPMLLVTTSRCFIVIGCCSTRRWLYYAKGLDRVGR